jgi:hypothetical protein
MPDSLNPLQPRAFWETARAAGHYPFEGITQNLLVFCEGLRQREFKIGPGEIADALRAIEALGVASIGRVQTALRLVCCAKAEDIEVFDRAFKEFFFPSPMGVRQDGLPPLEEPSPKKPGSDTAEQANQKSEHRAQPSGEEQDPNLESSAVQRTPLDDEPNPADAYRALYAKYSALNAGSGDLDIAPEGLEPMLRAAGELVNKLRLGHSRKWRPLPKGPRFDFRRTLRHSLSTGGDALHAYWRGHPRRNPRIVLLLDGSRSMNEHVQPLLQFGYGLAQRSQRVGVFVFSTELKDITLELRKLSGSLQAKRLEGLVYAWGGGTRIGACLNRFVREHGSRYLSPDTLVIVFSDGLDVGEPGLLEQTLRELKRRSAGIVWLNPHLARPEFKATARGMRVALPFIGTFTHANDAEALRGLVKEIRLR